MNDDHYFEVAIYSYGIEVEEVLEKAHTFAFVRLKVFIDPAEEVAAK